ncbi:MAG: hypothetical protein JW751_03370 [Polyangiaceae bacterium]|nr:hypothetical protein [Polyangiaceae bacterium]
MLLTDRGEGRVTGALLASDGGFTLHAATVASGHNPGGREALVSYALRPPLAQERLTRAGDDLVRTALERPFSDGTVAVELDPLSLLCRLVATVHRRASIPVLAPASRLRSRIVPKPTAAADGDDTEAPKGGSRCGWRPWAELMQRGLQVNLEKCPLCGAAMKLRAIVTEPVNIRRYLRHLDEATELPPRSPARDPGTSGGRCSSASSRSSSSWWLEASTPPSRTWKGRRVESWRGAGSVTSRERRGLCATLRRVTTSAAPERPSPTSAWGAGRLSAEAEARFEAGVAYCGRFFMGQSEADLALGKLTGILETEGLPYAIIGAFALNEYGHRRATVDVDLVMREEDLQEFKRRHVGRGYEERTPGTGKLLDTEHGVNIDVLSTGRFPGDDKPKPIAFPDPATTAVRGARFALLPMPRFIELKLASGMVAPHRAKDLVDVQELIKSAGLSEDVALSLHPWVQDKFRELWRLAQIPDPF